MLVTTLQNLTKAIYTDFAAEYRIADYPKLHHVFAIVQIESSWDPRAESPYARGLMQISQPALDTINNLYGSKYTYDDMFNPSHNVWVGIRYLRWLWRAFKDFENRENLTVMAYNWGIGNVIDWLRNRDTSAIASAVPQETRDYLVKYTYWVEWYRKVPKV